METQWNIRYTCGRGTGQMEVDLSKMDDGRESCRCAKKKFIC